MCERKDGAREAHLDEEEREDELRDGRHDRLRRKDGEIHDDDDEVGEIDGGDRGGDVALDCGLPSVAPAGPFTAAAPSSGGTRRCS